MLVNAEKTKYMFMSHNHNAGQNDDDTKIANKSSENVAKFKYFSLTVTN
jgi:hypothetical protein